MSRSGQPPDLKKYMDKKLQIKLNANRMIVGTLHGFDQFMNLVVDNTIEVNGNEKNDIGMVVLILINVEMEHEDEVQPHEEEIRPHEEDIQLDVDVDERTRESSSFFIIPPNLSVLNSFEAYIAKKI